VPCGAALGISSRQPSGPASNQSHNWPSQTRPTTLIACCRSVALPSDRLAPLLQPCLNRVSTCVLAQPVKPEPTTFHRQFDSPAAVPARLAPGPPGLAFRIALRPSLRLCPQTEFPLQACALRLRSTLRPPSGLRSTPARTLRPAPSSPAAFQPALWPTLSQVSGFRLAPGFEPSLWQCHPAGAFDSWPEPCSPCRSSPPSLWDRLSGLRLQVNPSASALRLVPILPAPALRPAPLVSVNSSSLDPRALDSCEPALRLDLIHVQLAPPVSVAPPSDPASASPSAVSRLAPGTSLRVFRSGPALANQSFRCLSDRSSTPGLRPSLPFDPPACLPNRPRACALLRPFQLPSLCADQLAPVCSPSGSAAGLSVIHDSWLAPRVLPTGPFRIQPTTYCVPAAGPAPGSPARVPPRPRMIPIPRPRSCLP